MTIIRQGSLFDLQELYDLEPTQRFEAIFSTIDIDPIFAVERVNAYLKQFFQLNNVRYRTGKRAKVHFDLVTLVYHASKLAADRINAMLNQHQAA